MRTVSSNNTTVLPLGKQGENLAQKIIFAGPISWLKGYGPGTVQLLHQRPGEDTPYPVVIAAEADGSYSWAVTAADTALAGQGKCELRYLSGGTVVKSRTWNTIVGDALGEPSATPPEAQQGWVDQVLAAGSAAQEAADRAEAAALRQPYPNEETGTWWVWDAEAGAYRDTGISYGGSGGGTSDHTKLTGRNEADQHPMSAITGLEDALAGKQPNGRYLTDKDIDATLKEAGKAADAAAVGDALSSLSGDISAIPSGKDGITPTIGDNGNWYLGATDTGKPSRGETGPAGADGKDGAHGAAGADGHTPVKGTDYWTAEDQQSIVADVLAALPTWEGGSY